MFNLFKKKETQPIHFHSLNIKLINHKSNLYIGKIIKIDCDYDEEDGIIDNVKYFFKTIEGEKISSVLPEKEYEYCEKYSYAIIRSINDSLANILIICEDGYVNRYKIILNNHFNDGEAFIIKDDKLIDNKKIVGTIKDERYNSNQKIIFNCLEQNKLSVFIKK